MTEGNIQNNHYCFYCLDIIKTYQRETKLFEFSRVANNEVLKIIKNDFNLEWLHCSVFNFSHFPILTNKATIFLDNRLYSGKYVMRYAILDQTLTNGVRMVGQNAILTSLSAFERPIQ